MAEYDAIRLEEAMIQDEFKASSKQVEIISEPIVKKSQKLLAKKFGPLTFNFQVNSLTNSSARFNLDLAESFRIFTNKKTLSEIATEFKSDDSYRMIPELTADSFKTW
jgi:hypothetical protein